MDAIKHGIEMMFLAFYIALLAAAFALCVAFFINLYKQIKMIANNTHDELRQTMSERQERIEQAIIEAQKGNGTDEDWAIICSQCGVPPLHKLIGKQNVNSESRI